MIIPLGIWTFKDRFVQVEHLHQHSGQVSYDSAGFDCQMPPTKKNCLNRECVVVENIHTVIPETIHTPNRRHYWTRTAVHSWADPHTIDSLFFVFPSNICCKINKLCKYYEYQLTKCCLVGRLEGFNVSSGFLKIMKLIKYEIAKKFHNFHHCTL